MEQPRKWSGRAVSFAAVGLASVMTGKDFRADMTEDLARNLALALARLKQTTFALQPEVQELLDALNYVLVGDPHSQEAHRRMEVGKGMTPDGG